MFFFKDATWNVYLRMQRMLLLLQYLRHYLSWGNYGCNNNQRKLSSCWIQQLILCKVKCSLNDAMYASTVLVAKTLLIMKKLRMQHQPEKLSTERSNKLCNSSYFYYNVYWRSVTLGLWFECSKHYYKFNEKSKYLRMQHF